MFSMVVAMSVCICANTTKLFSAPIDTIKTRLQRAPAEPGVSAMKRITAIAGDMWKNEGVSAFYKGITPRVMRVAPGQVRSYA